MKQMRRLSRRNAPHRALKSRPQLRWLEKALRSTLTEALLFKTELNKDVYYFQASSSTKPFPRARRK